MASIRQFMRKVSSPFNYFRKACFPKILTRSFYADSGVTQCSVKGTPSYVSKRSSRGFHLTSAYQNEYVYTIQDLDDFNKRVLNNKTPTIIDFYATWCGPCKLLIPKLEQLVSKKKGKVILAKIDIDVLTEIADTYSVTAVPTVIALKKGKEVDKFVGLKEDSALESFVDKLIG